MKKKRKDDEKTAYTRKSFEYISAALRSTLITNLWLNFASDAQPARARMVHSPRAHERSARALRQAFDRCRYSPEELLIAQHSNLVTPSAAYGSFIRGRSIHEVTMEIPSVERKNT